MKYFLHDTNAFQDEKITELFMAHGYEGLGLFYSILEKLAHQEKPVKTAVLKQQLLVGKKLEKCWSFLESLQLISSNNGETFNARLFGEYAEPILAPGRPGIPKAIRLRVLAAGECCYCGSPDNLQVDHIYPYSRGGAHSEANFQCLCWVCNRAKWDQTEEEYFHRIGKL